LRSSLGTMLPSSRGCPCAPPYDTQGRKKTTQGHTGPHRATQGHTGSHRATQGHTGPHRATQGHTGPHRATQGHTGPHRATQGHTGPHRATQGHTGPHRATQGHTGPHSVAQELFSECKKNRKCTTFCDVQHDSKSEASGVFFIRATIQAATPLTSATSTAACMLAPPKSVFTSGTWPMSAGIHSHKTLAARCTGCSSAARCCHMAGLRAAGSPPCTQRRTWKAE